MVGKKTEEIYCYNNLFWGGYRRKIIRKFKSNVLSEIFNKELVLRFLINIKDELQNSLKLFENFPKKTE